MKRHRRKRIALALLAALTAAGVGGCLAIRPSNERAWSGDQAVLPYATRMGNLVRIHHIRNFEYVSAERYRPRYYDRTFDLDRLVRAWFVVEPFSSWRGPAHTFVSFEFAGDAGPEFVAISVEVRREQGEHFSPWRGLLRQYELMYVIGDERDLVRLRSNYRNDTVYLYPVRAPRERVRAMLLGMLHRANSLRARPEFYHTVTNTCTTNIVAHVNALAPGRVPLSLKVLFPGYSDRLAYDLGLLDSHLPFEELRRRSAINARAREYADDPEFSVRIREAGPRPALPPPASL